MLRLALLALVALFVSRSLAAIPFLPSRRAPVALKELKYSRSHSLGDHYTFDVRDGWQSVNVSNLQYKYQARSGNASDALDPFDEHGVGKRAAKEAARKTAKAASKSLGDSVKDVVKAAIKGLKAIGSAEKVTITW